MGILVTGADGQLGRELCRQLGAAAIPRDIDTLDLTDGAAVMREVAALQPRLVINCAAYTQVDQAETAVELCRAVNAAAVAHLAAACNAVACPLLHISTDYVFGACCPTTRPWREDDPPTPQGVYAQTKREGELEAARHAEHLIVRTCGLYGRPTDSRAHNFVRTMLRLGRQRREVRVVNDQRCTPTYVPHLARAILWLADAAQQHGTAHFSGGDAAAGAGRRENTVAGGVDRVQPFAWGIYHVTNGGVAAWHEFATELFRLAEMPVAVTPITTAEYGAAAPRPSYSVLDGGRYRRIGGPALPDWRAGLADYIAEWRAAGEPM